MGEIIQIMNFTNPNPLVRMKPPAHLIDDRRVAQIHPEFPQLLRDMVHENPKNRISVARALERLEAIERAVQ
jgi:hypothetical protein